jgi:hypothetical protein
MMWLAAIRAARDHVLHANSMVVDRVDLATPLSLTSQPATGPSTLAPAQRAGAQRLRALAHRDLLHRRIAEIGRPPSIGEDDARDPNAIWPALTRR